MCSKVVLQRSNPDGFDRLGVAVKPLELATTLMSPRQRQLAAL